jgi:hypothetical protein
VSTRLTPSLAAGIGGKDYPIGQRVSRHVIVVLNGIQTKRVKSVPIGLMVAFSDQHHPLSANRACFPPVRMTFGGIGAETEAMFQGTESIAPLPCTE